jgi:hypothetical protein
LIGTILTTNLLHHLFVEKRIACDPNFAMVDRSPRRALATRLAA